MQLSNLQNQLGLDKYFNSLKGPVSSGSYTTGVVSEMQQEIQARRIRTSFANFKNFIQLSSTATGYGTFANGASLTISTTLTPQPPHQNDVNFAIPYVAVYLGSFVNTFPGTAQIFPSKGNGVVAGNFTVTGNTDWHLWQVNGTPTSAWSGLIINNSGATGTITLNTQWKWINTTSGTIT